MTRVVFRLPRCGFSACSSVSVFQISLCREGSKFKLFDWKEELYGTILCGKPQARWKGEASLSKRIGERGSG